MPAGALSPAVYQYFLPQAHPGVTVPWYLTDWFYVGLTIVVFAFLYLILKGIETFER